MSMDKLLPKLTELERTYHQLGEQLSDPTVLADNNQIRELSKKRATLEETIQSFDQWKQMSQDLEDSRELLKSESDAEMKAFLTGEVERLETAIADLADQLQILLLPRDPNDSSDIMLEIRGSAGGDEANIFAGDLYRMYCRYADSRGWQTNLMSMSESDMGGFSEVVMEVNGEDVYRLMKYESGVHRVQRVPVTESQGRVHTSTATVAVMPEVEDVDVQINPTDIEIMTIR
ncbi:MAG: PCRF domain-containing protein, partial [Vampirovibrio sp.]|nr:PCRF domain-containing protein [Vampirovibrio sp.]